MMTTLKNHTGQNTDLPKLEKKDWILMSLITLIGGFFIFLHLGSMMAPESFMTLDSSLENGDEIILDFGEEIEIKELSLFLGHMEKRTISLSYYDAKKEVWTIIDEDAVADAVYRWEKLEVNTKLQYLGLVARDNQAIFNELVIFDINGEKQLPVNASGYPELFDEQDRYPKDNTYYYGTMFDEIYYSRSAYEILNGIDSYEWTHPPLSKILMAIGIILFGVTPFGWRFICALTGILILPVMYLWLHRITGQTKYASIAAAFAALDFMHLTLSRIGTIDSIVSFFILLMFMLMYTQLSQWGWQIKQNNQKISLKEVVYIVSGAIATGMACACKWTGFYATAGIALLFLFSFLMVLRYGKKNKTIQEGAWRRFWLTGISYLSGLLSIYLLSYIPMAKVKGISVWKAAFGNFVDMLNYHSNLTFDHPYSSPWYSWLINWQPLIDSSTTLKDDGYISLVVTMGNPIIWWCGLAALGYILYRTFLYRDKKAFYLSFCYLSMLVPWIFISRTVFIYQYYVCSLILSAILAYTLQYLDKKWKNTWLVGLNSALVCTILFYPILTGAPVYAETVRMFMQWLPRWKFV